MEISSVGTPSGEAPAAAMSEGTDSQQEPSQEQPAEGQETQANPVEHQPKQGNEHSEAGQTGLEQAESQQPSADASEPAVPEAAGSETADSETADSEAQSPELGPKQQEQPTQQQQAQHRPGGTFQAGEEPEQKKPEPESSENSQGHSVASQQVAETAPSEPEAPEASSTEPGASTAVSSATPEAPARETSAPETPVAETPVAETPVAETPVETSADETPAPESSVAEKPEAEVSAAAAPAAETPVAQEQAPETAASETQTAEAPAAEAPVAVEAAVEEAVPAETPVAESTPATPASETPASETPAAETSAAEKSAAPAPASGAPALGAPASGAPASGAPAGAIKKPAQQRGPREGKLADKGGRGKPRSRDKGGDKNRDRTREFRDYFEFNEAVDKVPPHRVLAIRRGEWAKVLRVRVEAEDSQLQQVTEQECVPAEHPHAEFLKGCAADALKRLITPSLEREVRKELNDKAETHAVEVFARNLRSLLLQPPVRGHRVLAIDPGFRSGCKLAALDEHGNLLEHDVIFLVGKPERRAEAGPKLVALVEKHNLSIIAIGNGTACRETEQLVAEAIGGPLSSREPPVSYLVVNEAGASVYSASQIGRDELPDLDATTRGTLSIGRRLLDPLSELVKIEPQHIGVGLYQHDLKQKHLQASLEEVVESCVNRVGVDLNTASLSLLRYVSGLNALTARKIVEHRQQHGAFASRENLKEVQGFGPATFTQAAGFLKVPEGSDSLDRTWIHPESYPAARKLLESWGFSPESLQDPEQQKAVAEKAAGADEAAIARDLEIGPYTVRDLLENLQRPGRDPRDELPPPVFKKGVLKLEDLQPEMELTGTVQNVVDFGAFVDIGLKDSGLVHISQLANRFVRDPHEVVSVGDIVTVWVMSVDPQSRRVSLTMIKPGTKREPPPKGGRRGPRGEAGAQQGGPQSDAAGRDASQEGAPRRDARQEGGPQGGSQQGGSQQGGSQQGGQGQRGEGRGGPRGGRDGKGRGGPRSDRPRGPSAPDPALRIPGPPASRLQKRGPQDRRKGPQKEQKPQEGEPTQAEGTDQSKPAPKVKLKKQPKLTKAMKEGREPLRSFGDLFQVMQGKDEPPKKKGRGKGGNKGPKPDQPAMSDELAPAEQPQPAEADPSLASQEPPVTNPPDQLASEQVPAEQVPAEQVPVEQVSVEQVSVEQETPDQVVPDQTRSEEASATSAEADSATSPPVEPSGSVPTDEATSQSPPETSSNLQQSEQASPKPHPSEPDQSKPDNSQSGNPETSSEEAQGGDSKGDNALEEVSAESSLPQESQSPDEPSVKQDSGASSS